MRAGRLDHRWSLLESAEALDEAGQPVVTWQVIAQDSVDNKVWGSWEPLKGSEAWSAKQVVERAVARVRFRYEIGKQLTALNRIDHDDLGQFEIIGEPEQKQREGETVVHVSRIVDE